MHRFIFWELKPGFQGLGLGSSTHLIFPGDVVGLPHQSGSSTTMLWFCEYWIKRRKQNNSQTISTPHAWRRMSPWQTSPKLRRLWMQSMVLYTPNTTGCMTLSPQKSIVTHYWVAQRYSTDPVTPLCLLRNTRFSSPFPMHINCQSFFLLAGRRRLPGESWVMEEDQPTPCKVEEGEKQIIWFLKTLKK